jgi:translation initiation factor IF-3
LDLVEISPSAEPPVAKITDWGKFNYQRTKQQQIGQHDLDIKLNRARKFLEAGHKVKLVLFYRGREQAHKEIGFTIAQRIISDLGDTIVVEQQPQLAGRQLSFVVRSSGRKQDAQVKDA